MSGPTGLVSALWSDLKESKSYFLAGEGGSQGVNSQRCGEIKTIEVGGGWLDVNNRKFIVILKFQVKGLSANNEISYHSATFLIRILN